MNEDSSVPPVGERLGKGDKGDNLTAKEREIVRLLLSGLTIKEIAASTGRHQSTIYEHLHHIRERLGLRTIAETAVYGIRHGLDPRTGEPQSQD